MTLSSRHYRSFTNTALDATTLNLGQFLIILRIFLLPPQPIPQAPLLVVAIILLLTLCIHLAVFFLVLADLLVARKVRRADELDLGLFEPHGRLLALLDEVDEPLGGTGDPDAADAIAVEFADARLVEVAVRDARE